MTDLVYFQFLGSGKVPSRTISVERTALQAQPESLLTKLADEKWKKLLVGTSENPIVTKPLESLGNTWLPNMTSMIESAYKQQQQQEELVLPPNVELEEALTILDFYGLPVENPENIQLNQTDLQTRLRAKIFLEDTKNYRIALESIVDEFENNPQYEKNFIFVHANHDMPYIHVSNNTIFTTVPSAALHDCFQWVQRLKLRKQLLADLKTKGFKATWKCNINHGMSVLVAGPSRDSDYDNREERHDDIFVACVKVPEPEPVAKRQKLSNMGDDDDDNGDN